MQSFGGRRSLDGPVRRVRATPAPEPVNPSSAPPLAPIAPAAFGAVFEYRRPYRKPARLRGGMWRYARLSAIFVLVVAVGLGGWFGFKGLTAMKNIVSRSTGGAPALAGVVDPTKLKGEGDGRINVLVLGVGGQGHEAPMLSDTMLVLSIDPRTKDAAMLSIPRDLYVKIPATGRYGAQYGKINSANVYGGPELASQVVSTVIGVPVHYYVQVDFSGFRQAIDAVGGIDLNVPTAINDPSYPCDNERGGFCPFQIAAGAQHLNGTVALRYARSRKTTSDFDRATRQQLVIAALRQKALQASTLTNPVKLTGLIDAVGTHVKTDMQPAEIQKMASLAKDIDSSKMVQKVIDTSADGLLVDSGPNVPTGRGYVSVPKAGTFDYSDIQDFVKNIFIDHYITDENARIEIQNGTGVTGLAGRVVQSLKSAHYNMLEPTNAPAPVAQTVIYDYTGGKKPYTINYLERRFGVHAQRVAAPEASVDASGATTPGPEIRIILGSNYRQVGAASD